MSNTNELDELKKLAVKHAHYGHGGIRELTCTSFDEQELEMFFKDVLAWHQKQLIEARIGWEIELPDLPWFQIRAFNEERAEWVSPIYDTKNLPAHLSKTQDKQTGGGNG